MSMKTIIQTIKKNKKFLISTHVNPDPDALCSELAIAIYLKSLGKQVSIVNHEALSKRFDFLPGSGTIKAYKAGRKINYDVAIVVDCGDLNRIGKVQELLVKGKVLINIDHHVTNTKFGTLNLVQPKASSTAEVLYELLSKARCKMTKSLATHLYLGIMTDTGSFRYESTTARTHAITAELMKCGISPTRLYRKLYEIISVKDLTAFTQLISKFDMVSSGKVVCVELPKKSLDKFSGEFDLRDTIFKFLRAMMGVEVFVIFTQSDRHTTRVNFRSSQKFDVAKLASQFNGGGHKRASGGLVKKNIKETRKDVLRAIRKAL